MKMTMTKVIAMLMGLLGLASFQKSASAEELLKTKADVQTKSFAKHAPPTQDF